MKSFIANILVILLIIIFFGSAIALLAIIITIRDRSLELWTIITPLLFIISIAIMGPTEKYFKDNCKF